MYHRDGLWAWACAPSFASCILLLGASLGHSSEDKDSYAFLRDPKWQPYSFLDLKAGTQRNIGQVGVFMPIGQNESSMLFADFRFMGDTDHAAEGNFGLGYRQLYNGWVLGGYGFFDHRNSPYGNTFNQLTLGTEALSTTWEGRANVYIPISSRKLILGNEAVPTGVSRFAGRNEFIQMSGGQSFDTPLGGGDVEVGYQVLKGLRIYGGGYYFSGKAVPTIRGVRSRITYDINKWAAVEGQAQYDNVRKKTYFVGVRLTIPLQAENRPRELSETEELMTRPIVRDVDIVTLEQKPSGPAEVQSPDKLLHFSEDSEDHYRYADGSWEHPFNPVNQKHRVLMAYIIKGDSGLKTVRDRKSGLRTPVSNFASVSHNLLGVHRSWKHWRSFAKKAKKKDSLLAQGAEKVKEYGKKLGKKAKKEFLNFLKGEDIKILTASAIKIQSRFRGYVKRKGYKIIRKSAVTIQTKVRGFLARRNYAQTKAAVKIQKFYRKYDPVRKAKSLALKQLSELKEVLNPGDLSDEEELGGHLLETGGQKFSQLKEKLGVAWTDMQNGVGEESNSEEDGEDVFMMQEARKGLEKLDKIKHGLQEQKRWFQGDAMTQLGNFRSGFQKLNNELEGLEGTINGED